jgi:glycosyltransferase involved in cell wall biosynthesis
VLLLVGDGPDRTRIRRMVDRRGLQSSVVLTGEVPDAELPAHLDAGDVFAMPSRSRWFGLEVEAFGIVYLEAAACGLRVVAGRSGGIAEALGEAGRLEPRGSGAAGVRGQRAVERGAGVGEELGHDTAEGPQDDDEERGDRGREEPVLH